MIPHTVINEIHQIPISEIIGQYITLKRKGSNYIPENNPFREEKTASFLVNDSKGVFKDFGDDKIGDAITFVMEYQSLSYPQAVREICGNHKIEYQDTYQSDEQKEIYDKREALYLVTGFAANFYQSYIVKVKKKLNEWGFNDDTIETFGIGYAPGNSALLKEAQKRQYSIDNLKEVGIVKEKDNKLYDLFYDRIMFPVYNASSKVLGFGARRIDDSNDNNPKYINSTESDIYNKSKIFYGLSQAKKALRQEKEAIVVEGYTDVMAVYQNVAENVLATCGTAFTAGHADMLSKYVDGVVFVFDGDNSGQKAFASALEYCLKEGLEVKVVVLDNKIDPYDYVIKYGAEEFQSELNQAKDGITHYAEILREQSGNDKRKMGMTAQIIMNQVKLIPDVYARHHYVNDLAKVLELDKSLLKKQLESLEAEESKEAKNELLEYDFWEEKTNKKTGEKSLSLNYVKFFDFLKDNGYYLYSVDDHNTSEDTSQFIHLDGKIANPTNPLNITHFTLSYLEGKNATSAKNMLFKGIDRYFSTTRLKGGFSYPQELVFNEDSEDSAYLYFKNSYVEISADKVETKDYKDLHNYTWGSHIRQHNFEHVEDAESLEVQGNEVKCNSDFAKFVWLCATGKGGRQHLPQDDNGKRYNPHSKDVEITDEDLHKFYSFCTAIGYMITSHKNAAHAPAVLAVDATIPNNNEPNGRTGKSLLGKAISKVVKTATIDARNFNFNNDHAWEDVTMDTKVINFNDTPAKFPFDRLFSIITEGITVNPKHASHFFIPFESSPKIYINSNFVLKGEGDSNMDRQFILEFSEYFNSRWKPENEFGRLFFAKWDDNEWNRFYSFIIHCVQQYYASGLHPFPIKNYELRKLMDKIPEQLLEYFEEIELGKRYPKRDVESELHGTIEKGLFDEFLRQTGGDFDKLRMNSFTRMIKEWCQFKNYEINKHKNGERDKQGSHEYITITEVENKNEE